MPFAGEQFQLGLRVLQDVRQHHGGGVVGGVGGDRDEAAVADVAAGEHGLPGAGREQALVDLIADRPGTVGEERADLAVAVELLDGALGLRVGLPAPPQRPGDVVQPWPQLRGGSGVFGLVERSGQGRRAADGVVQDGPHGHRPGEVRRRRVGELAGVGPGPVEQGGHRRDVGGVEFGAVVDQGGVGLLPHGLAAVDRDPEVVGDGGVGEVDELRVRQGLVPPAGPQVGLHPGGEVLPVDPDRVHRPVAGPAGLHLAEDLVDRVDGVGDLHLVQRDARLAEFVGDVAGDEGVEGVVTAVHVPVHGLPVRLRQHRVPVRPRGCHRGGLGCRRGCDAAG